MAEPLKLTEEDNIILGDKQAEETSVFAQRIFGEYESLVRAAERERSRDIMEGFEDDDDS